MADVVTFDPENLRIVEIDVGGDNVLNVVEVYSEWKDWLLADPVRLRYPAAFRFVGGDPTSPTANLGSTFFIMNNWRIRPAERNHRLEIVGNLYADGGVDDPIVSTLGGYNVRAVMRVSNLTDVILSSASNPTAAQIADAVWDEAVAAHAAPGSFGELQTGVVTLTVEQVTMLREMYKVLGLDPLWQAVVDKYNIRVPADGSAIHIRMTHAGSGDAKTVTKQRL